MYERELQEVYEIIDHMEPEDSKIISKSFMNYIFDNADFSHGFEYDVNKTLEEQDLMENTKVILAIIYLKYFVKDEEEKKEILTIMKQNDEEEERIKQEKYNPDNLFKNTKMNTNAVVENAETGNATDGNTISEDNEIPQELMLVETHKKWYLNIWNKIKKFLRNKRD